MTKILCLSLFMLLILLAGLQLWPALTYADDPISLNPIPVELFYYTDWTHSIAWGDVDGDGDLDLAVGNLNAPIRIYLNEDGLLETTAAWSSNDSNWVQSVAWGDVDGDGDLDLATGNWDASNEVYLNEDGILQTTATWSSNDLDDTHSIAWGDVDGDGDLDLAAGNAPNYDEYCSCYIARGENKVYMNEGGMLQAIATWSSDDEDWTYSIAWGDMDGDGDLDLAAGNSGGPNKVYLNEDGILQTTAVWSSSDSNSTHSVAWGDMDGDSDLDLAVGNDQSSNKVYLNEDGILQTTAVWSSSDGYLDNWTHSIAWGDVDSDGDLDLASGDSKSSIKVYLNEGGMLQTTAAWNSSGDSNDTTTIAWGDMDGDGDLDLATGNYDAPIGIYLNEGGMLQTTAAWSSGDDDSTQSIAWGDVDGDGDLDLATGNDFTSNKIYPNEDKILQVNSTWSSGDNDSTQSIAWGDVDGDGDLDLATGNWDAPNKVYLNEDGVLQTPAAWSSSDSELTESVAWGDVDDDGDLDLAAGGLDTPIRIYLNEGGMLQTTYAWSSSDNDWTRSLAWGDMDNDGDLDLATGNENSPIRIYLNEGGMLLTTATWISRGNDWTLSVAWGDVDNDGDLDLATGGLDTPIRIYLNEGGMLQTTYAWSSADSTGANSIAWGDVNGDGNLDLAASNQIYLNEGGMLQTTSTWSSADSTGANSIAWGDVDGDGDLDLATGNWGVSNKVYLNEGGMLQTIAVWNSSDNTGTESIAWGDVDGDGDLDLAAGNGVKPNRVYLNEGGMLQTTAAWSSSDSNNTNSIAWGDIDGDDDLDLAAGNGDVSNKVYLNEGGMLQTTAAWSSSDNDSTQSVAWGDVDGDGDLDLAAGNGDVSNKVYLNGGGMLQTTAAWSSSDNDSTQSVAWGDVDGDGDLDLAAGNYQSPNKVYMNEGGMLQTTAAWSSNDSDWTQSVAWGDVDGDGDLDLAAGNYLTPIKIYLNPRRNSASLANNPTYLSISRSGTTYEAALFSTAQIIRIANIPIIYTLFDHEGDRVARIIPQFSPNGGGHWLPATPGLGGDGLTNLPASPQGTRHIFTWNAAVDLIKNDNVAFRITVQGYNRSPILWPAQGAQSFSFRVEAAPWFVKVVNERGQAVAGAQIYYTGQVVTTTQGSPAQTDRAGLLRLNNPTPGAPLIALLQTQEQTTTRAAHVGWAYRTYLTNLNLDNSGTPSPTLVGQPGQQRLSVRSDNPLILFNLVVSVEWDADDTYLAMLEDAFRQASAYLYDLTDGQMAFGQVAIYDRAVYWSDADFQFSTKNTVRPYAFAGGITSPDKAHTIRVGRFWDGGSGNSGNWNEPNGYRTLIHEFGHYALHLYDAYFIRQVDAQGNFIGELPAACTSEAVRENSNDPINASLMYFQYNASELADKLHNWDENCEVTEQYRLNGESDWETILRYYGWHGNPLQIDPLAAGANWTLNTPSSRGGVMAGPAGFPNHLLPFPEITINNSGVVGGSSRQLTVRDPQGQPVHNALVALYASPEGFTIAIDQGLTDQQGQIAVYGAAPGDTIRATTFNGALAGAIPVETDLAYQLTLAQVGEPGVAGQDVNQVPYLSLTPQSDGDTLYMQVAGLAQSSLPLDAFIVPGEGGGSPQSTQLAYSPTRNAYAGTVSLSGVGLGTGRVRVSGPALPSSLISDYNLLRVDNTKAEDLFSEDGNFHLHLQPGSLPAAFAYATVLPTGYVPGSLPEGQQVIGSAYQVRLSGALVELDQEGLIRLHYHPAVMGVYTDTAIYYWDASDEVWQKQGGEPGEIDNALAVPVTRLGIYALMGVGVAVENEVYLPVIVK